MVRIKKGESRGLRDGFEGGGYERGEKRVEVRSEGFYQVKL